MNSMRTRLNLRTLASARIARTNGFLTSIFAMALGATVIAGSTPALAAAQNDDPAVASTPAPTISLEEATAQHLDAYSEIKARLFSRHNPISLIQALAWCVHRDSSGAAMVDLSDAGPLRDLDVFVPSLQGFNQCEQAYGRLSAAFSCVSTGGEIWAGLRIEPMIRFKRWRI